jgi:ribosomal protein L40E
MMVSNEKIEKFQSENRGYLYCEKCGGYYELQDGESPDDFDTCQCGGNLKYADSISDVIKAENADSINVVMKTENTSYICMNCGTNNKNTNVYNHSCFKCGFHI